jgi:hypothetical protein
VKGYRLPDGASALKRRELLLAERAKAIIPKRKAGRPKGSKNKPKEC